jgi:hypothetical protein
VLSAQLGCLDTRLTTAVRNEFCSRPSEFSLMELANVAWSLAVLQSITPEVRCVCRCVCACCVCLLRVTWQ